MLSLSPLDPVYLRAACSVSLGSEGSQDSVLCTESSLTVSCLQRAGHSQCSQFDEVGELLSMVSSHHGPQVFDVPSGVVL